MPGTGSGHSRCLNWEFRLLGSDGVSLSSPMAWRDPPLAGVPLN